MLKANGARDEQVVVLPNGVDGVWFDRPPTVSKGDGTRFLMVGRNEYRKGFHILEKALLLLKKPIELHLVGDWPKLKSTHHKLTYHGVLREKEQMMEIMDSCDVLLLPSLSEGMPTVVLEAMARGLQIVGTDVGAMSVLEPRLIRPGDADALANMMKQKAYEMPKLAGLPNRFRWSNIARACLDAFREK
jgi:glycosyltransferase involved in cell wall biosynthesis